MQIVRTDLPGVLIVEPRVHGDARGFFLESWNSRAFAETTGVDATFVQDNHSRSAHGVLRGIHYQLQRPQGKLVRVVSGEVMDVAIDLRRSSPNFGRWTSVILNSENHRQLWVPPGFGHGFVVRSASADLLYKTTDFYVHQDERCIAWDDPDLAVHWQLGGQLPKLSERDRQGCALAGAEVYA